jgi:hypothetical protein
MTQETPRKKRPRDPAQLAKFVVDVATGEIEDREPTPEEQGKDPAAMALGRKGGLKAAKLALKKCHKKSDQRSLKKQAWPPGIPHTPENFFPQGSFCC